MSLPRGPLSVVPCLLASLLALPATRAQEARRFDDAALAPPAASLARYLGARAEGRGLDEARSAVATDLEALAGADALRHAGDLGRALWLAREYDAAKLKAGKVVTEVLADGSFAGGGANGIEVAYRLPKGYDPRGDGYPLLLAIPDRGEDPAEHLRVHWTHAALLDGAILLSPAMPAASEAASHAASGAASHDWTQVSVNGRPAGLCRVLSALRLGVERFAADPDRIFVVGQGAGVPAAIAAGNYAPQRFAGVIGRGGDAGDGAPSNFKNLPTLFVGGGAQADGFHKAAEAAGFDNCELAPTAKEEDVWRWIRAHPRDAAPTAVTLVVGTPFPTRLSWLRVAPSAPDAGAVARIERDTNTIRIDGHGVSHATLYLNDALVDLSKPVTVICNGIGTTGVLPRSLSTFLDLVSDGTSDAGCVYTVEAVFDMSGEEVARPASAVDADDLRELAAAGADVEKLWVLYERCAAAGRAASGDLVLKKLVRVDPDHAEARAALGHVRFADAWFGSPARLERFRRGQDDAVAGDKGFVKHKGVWMHPDDRVRASKGLVQDRETGLWLSVDDRRRLADGWARQDLEWVKPEDAVLVDEGLWRVDGDWVDLALANRRHARVDSIRSMWRIPTPEVLLFSTADRDVALRAAEVMGRAIDDLQRVFGAEPALPLPVAVLRDEEQYDRFAFGDPDGRRPATHAGRLHVIHSAFFAESSFPFEDGKREFRGMGVCYWDPLVPYGDLYGVHSARLAVGLSYVDALDPSPKAVRQGVANGPGGDYYAAYQAEKVLPAWLRYGGAVYAERYFRDDTVADGGDPWWARAWSVANLKERGGLRPLSEVFAFALDPDDREDGLKLYIESGLFVAFLVDGECAPAHEALAAFRAALAGGRLKPSHWKALEEALVEHEHELRAFAGL